MNVVTLGIRNAFRNATRTISIIIILGLSTGLSMVMLIANQAVTNKIQSTKASIGNTVTIMPAGYSALSSVNNALSTDQLKKVTTLENVTGVTELLSDRLSKPGAQQPRGASSSNATTNLASDVTLNVGSSSNGTTSLSGGGAHLFLSGGATLPSNFSLPVGIVGSNSPTNPNTVKASSLSITSGTAISGMSDTDNAMVSTNLAQKNNLKVGSTFTAYGSTLTVAAIYDSGTQSGNNNIIVGLPTEQRLTGQGGDVTSAVATINSLDNLSSATSAIKQALGSSADVTSSIEQANMAIQPLNSVKNVSFYSLIGAVTAGAVIILMVMVMIVRERRREIGILKAIGASNLRIMFQFMSEALTLTLLGAAVGLVIGIVGGSPVTAALISNSNSAANNLTPGNINVSALRSSISVSGINSIHAQIGLSVLLYGLGAALLIAVIGSGIAGWLIAKVRPSEVMRAE